MELPLVDELEPESPTRRASWNVPSSAMAKPSWIAPRPAARPAPPPPAPAPRPHPSVELAAQPQPQPEVHDKRDLDEIARLFAEVERMRGELARAAAALGRVRGEVLREAEPELVRLALAVAERVVGRTLAGAPEVVLEWAREGLAALAPRRATAIAVSRDVAAAFEDAERALLGVDVVVDDGLPAGSCVVRSDETRVDVSASARIRNIAEALASPEAP